MSDDQFAKLSEQIQQMDMDRRFEQIDKRLDKLEDSMLKLYVHNEQRFDKIEAELATKADKKDLDQLYSLVDTVIKNQEAEQQERAAMNLQLARHETWHHQAAERIGLTLGYSVGQ